ncbi:hypothetical protein NDU88_004230 [Pleurodeles waltl]|uniref:Uncharacterized protein n=1 Tax=Pleurodeles waltl TaxID=8319 RepID=A0AAV7VHM7_PLEWA|nr:hypothetical protein NDU88_004230 [Pleurodeles waltl]
MDARVAEAMRLLREASRLDLLADGVACCERPMRQAASGVAAAVAACSSPWSGRGRRAPQEPTQPAGDPAEAWPRLSVPKRWKYRRITDQAPAAEIASLPPLPELALRACHGDSPPARRPASSQVGRHRPCARVCAQIELFANLKPLVGFIISSDSQPPCPALSERPLGFRRLE